MNLFDPRTFSIDWELMVIDRLNRPVDSERLTGFAGVLTQQTDLPVHVDWNTIEFGLGINFSFAQFLDRINLITNRTTQLLAECDLDLYPAASHPVERMFNAAHVHVGTLHDEIQAIHLENELCPYLPVFAALSCNSPFAHSFAGGFKSYRIRHQAHGADRPVTPRHPAMTQSTWGTDALVKLYKAPTLEIRIIDCGSSRRFLAELATFIAAFVHHRGTQVGDGNLDQRAYQDYLTNRWIAARDGMQATFAWQGKHRPVADIAEEMLVQCQKELATLGASRQQFGLLNAMIAKRQCQADFVLALAQRYPEPYSLASVHAKLLRHWEIIDEYLASAPTLPVKPYPTELELMEEHLSQIGDGTPFYRMRDTMRFPPSLSDALIDTMVKRGLVEREVTPQRGVLLSRRK